MFENKMVSIKYYNLESQSWDDVSDLERNLQKHLLDQKHLTRLMNHPDEETARKFKQLEAAERTLQLTDGNQSPIAVNSENIIDSVIYDSGDFDVLYKKTSTIKKGQKAKKRWYWKNLPEITPRIEIDLVVKAISDDFIELQRYLLDSDFEVIEARNVTQARLKFATIPAHDKATANYKRMFEKLLKKEYTNLLYYLGKQDNVTWEDKKGSVFMGIVSGDLQPVLQIRNLLNIDGIGLWIKTEAITFYK